MRDRFFHRSRERRTAEVERREEEFDNLDAAEQRAFWTRAACTMWAGRERERRCPLKTPHPEHNYRYDATPDFLMYWCKGREGGVSEPRENVGLDSVGPAPEAVRRDVGVARLSSTYAAEGGDPGALPVTEELRVYRRRPAALVLTVLATAAPGRLRAGGGCVVTPGGEL